MNDRQRMHTIPRRWIGAIATSALTVCLLYAPGSYAWNRLGHRLVGQIAYNHLDPEVKKACNALTHALDIKYKPLNFINATAWLDTLRNEYPELTKLHYIDLPYSIDGTIGISPEPENVMTAIENAAALIKDKSTSLYDKGFALRILTHVIGDLHQPLHSASLFSKDYPKGDLGGNLYVLLNNSIASNLHAYWDQGGGLLKSEIAYSNEQVRKRGHQIEKRWPCDVNLADKDPVKWLNESYALATTQVYSIIPHSKPSKAYKNMARQESEKRLALAGCRLAAFLNELIPYTY